MVVLVLTEVSCSTAGRLSHQKPTSVSESNLGAKTTVARCIEITHIRSHSRLIRLLFFTNLTNTSRVSTIDKWLRVQYNYPDTQSGPHPPA